MTILEYTQHPTKENKHESFIGVETEHSIELAWNFIPCAFRCNENGDQIFNHSHVSFRDDVFEGIAGFRYGGLRPKLICFGSEVSLAKFIMKYGELVNKKNAESKDFGF